jgi:hypothetical protein
MESTIGEAVAAEPNTSHGRNWQRVSAEVCPTAVGVESCSMPVSEEELRSEMGSQLNDIRSRVATCRLEELHPHPGYVRHHLTVSELAAPVERRDLSLLEPLMITQDGTILTGYARVETARQQGLLSLSGIEYELTEIEALHWLLHKHRRSNGLNDFCRILLAMDLEPWFREKARSHQQAGGRNKGSSKLTEAGRLDVRREIAAAQVCVQPM